jgi:hypothetical protein
MAGALAYYTSCRARLSRIHPPEPCCPPSALPLPPDPPGLPGYPSDPPGIPAHPRLAPAGNPASSPDGTEATGDTRDAAGRATGEVSAAVEALRKAHPGWRVWSSGRTWYACGPWLSARLVHAPTAHRLSALITTRMEDPR